MPRRAVLVALSAVALVAGLAAGGAWWAWREYERPGPLAADRILIVGKGSGLGAIAATLATGGVIDRPWLFRLAARLEGRGRALRAGEYAFPAHISMRDAAGLLESGKTVKRRLTVAEGLTTAQIVALVAEAEGLDGRPAATGPDEGTLLPETYFYSYGDDRTALIRRMRDAMNETLDRLWAARAAGLAIRTRGEAVTLASIIEKETGVPEERARVSAVFHNRLRRGMRLQSDPTVVYALTGGAGPLGRALTRADLDFASPYNTYLRAGLPPGPIANPGPAAIEAALNPAQTQDLYFVADGSGGHVFARTLKEHNRNAARWRRLQHRQRDDGKR